MPDRVMSDRVMSGHATRLATTELHPLRPLAGAIVGRPVTVTHVAKPELPAHTDGERILIPDGLPLEEARHRIIIQGMLLNRETLGLRNMGEIVGRHDLCSRYLVLEVERRRRELEERLPRALLERLEPFRIDLPLDTAADSLRIAKSLKRLPAPPPWFGRLQPWKVLRKGVNPVGSGGGFDAERLRALDQRAPLPEEADDDEDDDGLIRTSFWKYLSSPFGKDSALSRFMRDLLDMKSMPDGNAANSGLDGSSEMASSRMTRRPRDVTRSIRSTRPPFGGSDTDALDAGVHRYPEWDEATKRYRHAWTSVEEVDPIHGDERADAAVIGRGSDRAHQSALAGLRLGFEKHRREVQGDDLVLDRMVRLAVDLRAGRAGDPRIYAAPLRTRRDLAVSILLDVSSSTLEMNGKGERVFDLQATTAWRLCHALTVLGDRVALHGFHSWGRKLVRMQVLKDFDEAFGEHPRRRLARVAAAGYTRCGAAIRHGAAVLEARAGMPFKLLLLISDGYPYDDQYEGSHAAADTRKAVEELRDRGIACVCLSVGGDADAERLRSVYGATNHLAVDDPSAVPRRLRCLIENALADAHRAAAVSPSSRRGRP